MYRKLLLSLAILGLLSGPVFGQAADVDGSGNAGPGGVSGSGSVDTRGADVEGSVSGGPGGGTTDGTVDDAAGGSHDIGND